MSFLVASLVNSVYKQSAKIQQRRDLLLRTIVGDEAG
jgi:hypothetical protein